MVASQLKIFIPVGMPTTIVEAAKKMFDPADIPTANIWCAHTLTETTAFHDTWVKVADAWRLQSRAQIGQPKVQVDKPAY